MIRSGKTHRNLSWLALFAILLVAIAPTVSQFRAAVHATASHHHVASNDSSSTRAAHEHTGKSPDDCWKKCGYCDFLHHSPAAGSVNYLAAIATVDAILPVTRLRSRAAHASYVQAAQPRGPPLLA